MVKWRVWAGGTPQAGRTFNWQVAIRAGTLLQGTQGECTARATRHGPEVEGGAAARTRRARASLRAEGISAGSAGTAGLDAPKRPASPPSDN